MSRDYWKEYREAGHTTKSERLVRCMLCGLRYDSDLHKACPSCEPRQPRTVDTKK